MDNNEFDRAFNKLEMISKDELSGDTLALYNYIDGIISKIMASDKFLADKRDNVELYLSSVPNAALFTKDVNGKRPLVIGPKLFSATNKDNIKITEDHIAAVIGHELGHYKTPGSSKVNEISADIEGAKLLQSAGYAPIAQHSLLDIISGDVQKSAHEKLFTYLDEHPSNENRQEGVMAALSGMRFKVGELKNEMTDIPSQVNLNAALIHTPKEVEQRQAPQSYSRGGFGRDMDFGGIEMISASRIAQENKDPQQDYEIALKEFVKNPSCKSFSAIVNSLSNYTVISLTSEISEVVKSADYKKVYQEIETIQKNNKFSFLMDEKNVNEIKIMLDLTLCDGKFDLGSDFNLEHTYKDYMTRFYNDILLRKENYPQNLKDIIKIKEKFKERDFIKSGEKFIDTLNPASLTFLQTQELEAIINQSEGEEKISYLENLIKDPPNDVNLRKILFSTLSDEYLQKYGKDDGSDEYAQGFEHVFDVLKKSNLRTRSEFSKVLADKVSVKRNLSKRFEKMGEGEYTRDSLKEAGCEAILDRLKESSENANEFLEFLQKDFSADSANSLKNFFLKQNNGDWLYTRISKISTENLSLLHSTYWDQPLEVKSGLLSQLVLAGKSKNDFDKIFDYGIKKIIPENAENKELITNVIKEYINSYDYEKPYLLSAMIAAQKSTGQADNFNVGEPLKEFLENIGPAGIKLGQALGSSPDVPRDIRDVMQTMKNSADKPTRWGLYEIVDATVPKEVQKDIGSIIGSGSYYITVDNGDGSVLSILRPYSKQRAEDGFNVMLKTCENLEKYEGENYKAFSSVLKNIITKAQSMTDIEVDTEIGATQDKIARQLYNGKTMQIGKEVYQVQVADWLSHGESYKNVAMVSGVHFNDLEKGAFKTEFAKEYLKLELDNIFSGGNFDHDRHGAQLKIDPENKIVGIFDNGAMSTWEPSKEDKQALGKIINKVISKSITGGNVSDTLINAIQEEMKEGNTSEYILSVQRGLLALNDFMNELSSKEKISILSNVLTSDSVDKAITGEISFKNKLVLKTAKAFIKDEHNVDNEIFQQIVKDKSKDSLSDTFDESRKRAVANKIASDKFLADSRMSKPKPKSKRVLDTLFEEREFVTPSGRFSGLNDGIMARNSSFDKPICNDDFKLPDSIKEVIEKHKIFESGARKIGDIKPKVLPIIKRSER